MQYQNMEIGKKIWDNPQVTRNFMKRLPLGYTCYQAVFDQFGRVSDYIVVDMNPPFEALSGLKKENVVGKRLSDVLTDCDPEMFSRLTELGNETLSQKDKSVEKYVRVSNHAYKASVFFVSESLMFGTYEDIQPRMFKDYCRSIPHALLERSIAALNSAGRNSFEDTGERRRFVCQNGGSAGNTNARGLLPFFPESSDSPGKGGLQFRDSLTGVYDRSFAMKTLNIYTGNKTSPLSVALGDVNGLREINEDAGYGIGDRILIQIAKTLQENCRTDDVVARWSGDAFILIFPCTTHEVTRKILGRLQGKLEEQFGNDGGAMVTFGYATNDKESQDERDLLKEAEEWVCRKKLLISRSDRSSVFKLLLSTLYEKSPETREHSDRMADYCRWIAEKLRLSDEMINDLILLSMLHDIGKMGIRQEILNKPGPLTAEERREVERHPEIGYRITRTIPELSQVSQYILAHHERWDGTGYPNGLRGEAIPIASRIVAVVDAYDVIVSGRVYRKARSPKEAISELKRCAGTQFDPNIVATFSSLIENGECGGVHL